MGSGGIVPHIHNFCSQCEWSASCSCTNIRHLQCTASLCDPNFW